MASKVPFVKQEIAWDSVIPQLLFLAFLSFIFYVAGSNTPILYGGILYLLFSFTLKMAIPLSHRKGIALIKKSKYA